MGKILQILIIENRDLAHAKTFCTRVVFVFTEIWSRDQLMQKAYFLQETTQVVGLYFGAPVNVTLFITC